MSADLSLPTFGEQAESVCGGLMEFTTEKFLTLRKSEHRLNFNCRLYLEDADGSFFDLLCPLRLLLALAAGGSDIWKRRPVFNLRKGAQGHVFRSSWGVYPIIFCSTWWDCASICWCRLFPWASMVTTTGNFSTSMTHMASGTPNESLCTPSTRLTD